MELVLCPIVIFLHILPDDVTAHLLVEELVDGAIIRQVHRRLQLSTFHLDEGFACPFVSVEYPTGQDLFGCQSLVAPSTIYLLAEVECVGLNRTDAVVIEDIQLAKLLCGSLWQDYAL